MATRTADLTNSTTAVDTVDGLVLTIQPDMRIVKAASLVPVLIVVIGLAAYLNLPTMDPDFKLAVLMVIATLGLAAMIGVFIMHEALGNAHYTITKRHIEEDYGIIYREMRRLPLCYVRDVAYEQSLLQVVFGVSSVTVSPTNGNKIVLSNIRDGHRIRDIVWELVLSKSPTT